MHRGRADRLVYLLALYPVTMGVALVYLAEHYVIDVLAGWAVVAGVCWFWSWFDRRRVVAVVAVAGIEPEGIEGDEIDDAENSVTPTVHDVPYERIH